MGEERGFKLISEFDTLFAFVCFRINPLCLREFLWRWLLVYLKSSVVTKEIIKLELFISFII